MKLILCIDGASFRRYFQSLKNILILRKDNLPNINEIKPLSLRKTESRNEKKAKNKPVYPVGRLVFLFYFSKRCR
ncbi:hypothetical protein CPT06_06620 [Bacillus vallismortis]|nr:hypothetical protein CPT06_06620 [Bacillus vallismortis]